MDWFFTILQILLGWLLADFLTGVMHWLEDRFGPGREHWPIIGPLVFAPNRLHHADPVAFTRQGFITRNWTTWAIVFAWALPMLWMFGPAAWLLAAILGGAMANEIHACAHRRTILPAWAQMPLGLLHRTGMLQSPAMHAEHHVPPYRRRYCTLTDWLNPLLDTVKFWSFVEAFLPQGWIRDEAQP
jgi:ubiquitin-conjugating enzyme E2 variant